MSVGITFAGKPQRSWLPFRKPAPDPAGAIADERLATGPDMPQPQPPGFRRGDIWAPFPGGWRAMLPGRFLAEREEEGGMVYWDAGRNFRLSAYRLDPNREYQPKPTSGDSAALAKESFERGGFRYDATVTREADKDFWMLQGTISGPGKLAMVTITWEESRWQEWALHTFRDVRPPKEEAERRSLPQ